ncbi:NADPH--cytochrome P450 reductase [Hondaea fermentalgiana]|uniref:NADPH--cytochrome P450 reductase n=1 Tax=Hondaea fermentalgiana TaxID=2315210 RepID=A0A2R5H0H9_9STRA|nr:NADPH--cytochrome P450 reductase [Hondaea fermentalgiana]|eukprot:GBG34563.1 NADPH--cytochrome P450 reductase [Hondaea fermentalgiana]
MGKGQGEMEGILQLAGGILFGGFALYKMTKEDKKAAGAKSSSDAKAPLVSVDQKPAVKVPAVLASGNNATPQNQDDLPSWVSRKAAPEQAAAPKATEEAKKQTVDDDLRSSVSSASDDSEEYIPSWMSRKDPKTRPEEVSGVVIPAPNASTLESTSQNYAGGASQVTSVNHAVARVAQARSDVVFVYPAAGTSYLGSTLDKTAGEAQILEMETRPGAGAAVAGAAAGGSRVTILATSASVKAMLPSLFDMAAKSLPVVIHVAALAVGDTDLAVGQDLTEVMTARDTGVVMLASATAEETQETALAAHALAEARGKPVLHFFDGARSLQQLTPVRLAPPSILAAPAQPAALAQPAAFEYSGSKTAEAVIVTMGAPSAVVEEAVSARSGHHADLAGVLRVRMLRPWSVSDLVSALPASTRRICVVDQAGALAPLFEEVAASIHSEAWTSTRPLPLLLSVRLPALVDGFTPAMAHTILNNVLSARPQMSLGAELVHASVNIDQARPAGTGRAIVALAAGGEGAASQIRAAATALASQTSSQVLVTEDPYAGDEGIVRAEIRVGGAARRLAESYAVQEADVVVLEQRALQGAGLLAAELLRDNGVVVVLPDASRRGQDQLSAHIELPAEVRNELSRKSARLVTVDAYAFLRDAAERSAEPVPVATLHAAEKWMALVAALYQCEGPERFSAQLVGQLRGALQGSARSALGSALGDALVTGVSRVEGYLTDNGAALREVSFGGPHAYMPRMQTVGNGGLHIDAVEASSFGSSQFGAMSPIPHARGAVRDANLHFVPRFKVAAPEESKAARVGAPEEITRLPRHQAALPLIFPSAYSKTDAIKPASREKAYQVRLTRKDRLTPAEYSRDIFHLEFDISDTDIQYRIGDALGVYPENDEAEVDAFIREYGLDPEEFVSFPSRDGKVEIKSVRNILISELDIFGKPAKRFYCALAGFASSRYEHLKLMHTGTDDSEAFKLGTYETVRFADLLLQYKSAKLTIADLIATVPRIVARHYSIASSQKLHPTSVHLLVVAVDWVTPSGKKRYGAATRFLNSLDASKQPRVTVDVISSVLRLPETHDSALILTGLGTGLAPFRAFVQERKWLKEQGHAVGPIRLYFGARHRKEEYLYGDEWDAYQAEGLVDLCLAFSRDQPEKIYVQTRMNEDKLVLRDLLANHDAHAYMCGPVWPVPDVSNALGVAMSATDEADLEAVEKLKKAGRYLLEVY